MLIGLTGGIACGKTSLAGFIRGRGFQSISTDKIGHDLLLKDSPCLGPILERWGTEILDTEGNVSREKLGHLVFNHQGNRQFLNSLLHPEIRRRWMTQAREYTRDNPHQAVFIEIPLLFETGAEGEFDQIVSVICSPSTQLERLIKSRELSREEALLRIQSQMDMVQKAQNSDFVVWNNYSSGHLERQAGLLLEKLGLSNQ